MAEVVKDITGQVVVFHHYDDWRELVNEARFIRRSNYGIRVARKGQNAYFCSDSQLLFNSGWPILQIVGAFNFNNGKEIELFFDNAGNPLPGIPAGYVESPYQPTVPEQECSANRRYIRSPIWRRDYRDPNNTRNRAKKYTFRKITHGLGFAPFFLTSEVVFGSADKIALFNVDLRNDVDYPYTDAPTELFSKRVDYGIKSKNKYRRAMPRTGAVGGWGINTNVLSKMVQAVKTEKTSKMNGVDAWGGSDCRCSWGSDHLYDFEAFSFCTISPTMNLPEWQRFDDGGDYFFAKSTDTKIYQEEGNTPNIYVGPGGQATSGADKVSLVVLRTPLVAPEVEELVYA